MRPENVLHTLLDFDELEQREALRSVEIEKDIDIGATDRFVARDRAEEKQRTDAGMTELWFMLPQQANGLVPVHMTLA
jgi:hypothetical protein